MNKILKTMSKFVLLTLMFSFLLSSFFDNNTVYAMQCRRLPVWGIPNGSDEIYNDNGSVKQRRDYDSEGKAKRDTDYNHGDDGTHKFPHQHDWEWDENGQPHRGKARPMEEAIVKAITARYVIIRVVDKILSPRKLVTP